MTVRLPKLSLVVPAYNEALMLQSSLTTLYAYLQSLAEDYRFELLIINDGSKDDTGLIAEAFALDRPEVEVLHNPVNFRLGEALRRGIASSTGDIVVTFDSDLSYSTDHIHRMVTTLREEHAKVVIASPYHADGRTTEVPFRRAAMSRAANRLLAVSSAHDVTTVTGMVRAYDGPFVRSLNLKAMGPEVNAEILYKAQILRARVVEIPAHLDWSNQSERLAQRRVSLRVSATTRLLLFASFLFRPLVFFTLPGALLLGVAGVVFATAFGGDGVDTTRLVIGATALVISIQLMSLGMLATQSKRYFEELFHLETHSRRRIDRLGRQFDELRSPDQDLVTPW